MLTENWVNLDCLSDIIDFYSCFSNKAIQIVRKIMSNNIRLSITFDPNWDNPEIGKEIKNQVVF